MQKKESISWFIDRCMNYYRPMGVPPSPLLSILTFSWSRCYRFRMISACYATSNCCYMEWILSTHRQSSDSHHPLISTCSTISNRSPWCNLLQIVYVACDTIRAGAWAGSVRPGKLYACGEDIVCMYDCWWTYHFVLKMNKTCNAWILIRFTSWIQK